MEIDAGWVLLAIVGVALIALFLYALLRTAGDQDRAARHSEKALDRDSDVTITRSPW
jgi:hypothetical protein